MEPLAAGDARSPRVAVAGPPHRADQGRRRRSARPSQAFMTVRIRRLLDAGLLTDAAALAAMAQVPNDPGFARVQAEAILFAGQKRHVCDDTTATRLDSAEPFWIELRAYCYAMSGDDAALALTRAVMDAQNIDDEAFDTLLDDVRNNATTRPRTASTPRPRCMPFCWGRPGLPVGFDTAAQLGTPGACCWSLRSARNSPEDRLKAAERVLPTGALSADELIAIADAQSFTPDQFATEHAQVREAAVPGRPGAVAPGREAGRCRCPPGPDLRGAGPGRQQGIAWRCRDAAARCVAGGAAAAGIARHGCPVRSRPDADGTRRCGRTLGRSSRSETHRRPADAGQICDTAQPDGTQPRSSGPGGTGAE